MIWGHRSESDGEWAKPTVSEDYSGAASASSSSSVPTKRKRQNPVKSTGSKGDKLMNGKRGRPRVDPQDHNAVEVYKGLLP